jgi:hypothetical protein
VLLPVAAMTTAVWGTGRVELDASTDCENEGLVLADGEGGVVLPDAEVDCDGLADVQPGSAKNSPRRASLTCASTWSQHFPATADRAGTDTEPVEFGPTQKSLFAW